MLKYAPENGWTGSIKMMRRTTFSRALGLFLVGFAVLWVGLVAAQDTGVRAEAKDFANLRAGIGVDYDVVGQIQRGMRYPVLARSQFYPWLLIGQPDTFEPWGWVFQDLVDVYGDVNILIFSEASLAGQTFPTSTLSGAGELPTSTLGAPVGTVLPTSTLGAAVMATPTPTPTPVFNVFGVVSGEINLRYGPGADYPRLGVAKAGDRLEIVGHHLTLDWVQVNFPSAPNGIAWVSSSLIEITGDVKTTRAISQTDFSGQPTLTPTEPFIAQGSESVEGTRTPISTEFARLANGIWNQVLTSGFDPATSKFAGLYVRNLSTGEEFTFGNTIAFNGTSVNKVAVLAGLFNVLDGSPDYETAVDLANTMICSENVATNNVIARIGGGDMYLGSESITGFLGELGLTRTFLTAPYETPGRDLPAPTMPIRYPQTDVDQVKAEPNVTNQMTVDEMGHLLEAVYECGVQETGPLLTKLTTFTPQECRKMLYLMSNNTVDAFAKTGTPEGTIVSHKHGWVNTTHGNAAIIFTPGGDYIIVTMMYQPEWLNFQESLPLAAEISREVYNYLNPDTPLGAIRDGYIPPTEDCNYAGSELVEELVSPYFMETLSAPF